ncbi:peptidylprolyl isomerase [Coraliomargarita sp. W4R53]
MKRHSLLLSILSFLLGAPSAWAVAPTAPSSAGASIIDRNQLQISWQDNSDNEARFQIYTYANGSLVNDLGSVAANSTAVTIMGLSGGQSVQYAIIAFSAANEYDGGILTPLVTMPDYQTRYGHEATVGEPFSAILYSDVFGLQTSATLTGLPSGATFTAATRTFEFTPTEAGELFLNLEVHYSDGFSIIETVSIRILPAASGPVEAVALPSFDYYPDVGVQTVDLDAYFEDPDCSRAVRMTYTLGAVDIILYEDATPATVANFLAYVNGTGAGAYDGAMIHRSMSNFVIQGGGYRPIGESDFESVTDLAPVANEPGLENVRGTLSMAKLGGDPDSATNEWFVSLGDNRSNLDFQNGGFTVFARVAGDGMTVIDSIAALPTGSYNAITVDGAARAGLLSDCPMNAATAPATMEQDKLVRILSAVEVAPLAYSIVSNSNTTVATATIDNGSLQITPLAAGSCTLRVSVTDLDNQAIERDVTVVVGWDFAGWVEAIGLLANHGELDDADGDQFSNFIEYNLFGDPITPNASLTELGQVSYGTSIPKDYLAIEFSTRTGIQDAVVYVEASNELSTNSTWTAVWDSTRGALDAQVHSSAVGTEHVDWVIRDQQAIEASTTRFMRVRVQALVEE